MTPEASRFIEKAHDLLSRATTALGVNLFDDAGRDAYLAGVHIAQAFLYEQNQKVFTSHKGLRSEFGRETQNDPRIPQSLQTFLFRTYNLKKIADYETGANSKVSPERAKEAVEEAKQFIACVEDMINAPRNGLRKDPSAKP